MQFLKQSTASQSVVIGPFVDDTDGKTAETGLTIDAADIRLSKNGANIVAKNSGGGTHDELGYYTITLDATDTNTVGRLQLMVHESGALPVLHSYQVVEEAVYSAMFAASAALNVGTAASVTGAVGSVTGAVGSVTGAVASVTNQVTADVTAISGDSTAADNLEAMYDGTGYTDSETAPASRAQVSGIGAASGGALNYEATSDNLTVAIKTVDNVGTPTGTFGNTQAEDGSVVSIAHDTNDIDHIFGYTIGSGSTATEMTFAGYLTGANDAMLIQAYDFVGSDWETIAQLPGQAGSDNVTITGALLSKHTGTGSDAGNVFIRFEADGAMSSPTLVIDKLLVSAIATESGIVNGSTITLTSSTTNTNLVGSNWTLDLNGQAISGTYVKGATVTGVSSGTSAVTFEDCLIGTATLPPGTYIRCGFTNTFTAASNGDFFMAQCYSGVAGSGSPSFVFTGRASTTFNNRGWTGGITFTGAAGVTTSHEVLAGGGATFTPADGNLEIRGLCRSIALHLTDTDDGNTIQIIANTGDITIDATGSSDNATINVWGTHSDIANTSASTVTDEGLDTGAIQSGVTDILEDTGTTIPGTITTVDNEIAALQTDLDSLTDAYTEPTGVPAASATLLTKVGYLYMALRNQVTVTTSDKTFFDDGGTAEWSKPLSDDGTYTEGEAETP